MQNGEMRTTVNLDDEAYELAMLRASGRGITLGAALSECVREAQEARCQSKPHHGGLARGPKGMLMLPARKGKPVLTTEMVKKAILKMEDEEDERKAFPAGRQHSRRAL
jgi:hypothetical protein